MEVLEAEMQHHLRASVYSKDDISRSESNGIVKWLDGVLAGDLKDRYKGEAELTLDDIKKANSKTKVKPDSGTEWMADDGLGEGL